MYARTDIGGAYRWDTEAKRWVSLSDWVTSDTWNYTGIESIGVDPSDPKRLYIAAGTYTNDWAGNGAILRSADKGATWKIKPLPFKLGGNEDGRFAGERLAVDPGNGAVLFLGTRRNGLWKSTNRGETWAQVAAFPVPTTPNGVGIAFVLYDGRGVKRGATTQTIYAGVSDKGASLYRSTDGGATWQAVPGQPTGLMPSHGVWDANGDLYLSYGDAAGPNGMTAGAVHRFEPKTGVWTDVTPEKGSFGYGGIAADPKRAGV
ncbi:MAG: carbohydrate-binding protein, partial [Armatimonadetes bacterium]|nr:carbohydrate-binding protein [Armatimonadota bacterium]